MILNVIGFFKLILKQFWKNLSSNEIKSSKVSRVVVVVFFLTPSLDSLQIDFALDDKYTRVATWMLVVASTATLLTGFQK